MDEPIFNSVTGIFGKRGSGKTEYLKGNDDLNIPGLIPLYPSKGMRVLIVDTLDHPAYKGIPVIKKEQFPFWKKGIYRIWIRRDEMPEFVEYLNATVSNILIVFEDAYKHLRKVVYKSMSDLIIDSKQKNIDIIFMYHAWKMAPLDLYLMLDFIEIFKTKDTPKSREDSMPGYYDDAMEIYKQVMAHPSRFFHLSLNTEL